MPRLPTIRVIGSQAISTRLPDGVLPVGRASVAVMAGSPGPLRAGDELGSRSPPLGFLVDGPRGDGPQLPDGRAVHAGHRGRGGGPGRLVHEPHELVGEAGHRAADADAADVRAPADAVDPAALGHVALDDWTPTAKLQNAFG